MDALEIGTVFNGYRIEAVLGRGGMGVVYRATELDLERPVALKIVAPEHASDPGFRERFAREARTLASIEHPNVVRVFRYGEADGLTFLSMSYVAGMTLSALIAARRGLSPAVAARMVAEVAAALDAAHAGGLVHRDVKPSNILISGSDRSDAALLSSRVFLSDFGLSKRATSNTLTRPGQFLGTIPYVSPEQIQGIEVDGRVDQYALACVAYECLTGRQPFGDMAEAAVMMAHLVSAPPNASAARPELPHAVDEVIARGMGKDRERRYPSCGAFAAALGDALAPGLATVPPVVLPEERPGAERDEVTAGEPVPAEAADEKRTAPVAPPDRDLEDVRPAPSPAGGPQPGWPPGGPSPGAPLTGPRPRAEAGPPAESPSPSESPVRRTARRAWTRARGTGVLLGTGALAVFGVGALLASSMLGPGETPDPTPSASPAPTATADGSSGETFPNTAERLLLDRVPSTVRGACGPSEATPDEQEAVSAIVDCQPRAASEPSFLRYAQYADAASLRGAYDALLAEAHAAAVIDGGSGRCGAPPFVGGEGSYDHAERSGRVFCYAHESAASIVWRVDALRILVIAEREDGNSQALYEWWENPSRSGPLG